MNQELRIIPGFSNYSVSNDGASIYSLHKGRRINPFFDSNSGYWKIRLVNDSGKTVPAKVHRLVALAWCGNPDNFKCVCHRDDNKNNNNYTNLYWGTPRQNVHDRVRNGRQGNAKLLPTDIVTINKLYKHDKLTQLDIGIMFNIQQNTVSRIVNGKRWGCVQ